MDSSPRLALGGPVGSPSPARSRRTATRRWGLLADRGRRAAAALVLIASALVAGPDSSAGAQSLADPGLMVLEASARTLGDAERAIGERLALGYAGVVSAADVEALVRAVSRQQLANAFLGDQHLHTTEAVSRRALTDFLTRGTPLPREQTTPRPS
ncbi:MAG: hypothetical protein WA966_15100 [Ornithinimicrobium sp.]